MKKKNLRWSLPCSLAAALGLVLVAAPASASSMMPLNQKEVQKRDAQKQVVDNEQRLQELLKKLEADKKAMEDANKAAAQAAKERATKQLEQTLSDKERQQLNVRMEQKKLNTETPQRPEVGIIPTRAR